MPTDTGQSFTIDLTAATDWLLIRGTDRPVSVASLYVTKAPDGFSLELRVGKGEAIPVNVVGFGIEAVDPVCDPMSGGLFYRVPVAQAGQAVVTFFPAKVALTR